MIQQEIRLSIPHAETLSEFYNEIKKLKKETDSKILKIGFVRSYSSEPDLMILYNTKRPKKTRRKNAITPPKRGKKYGR